MQRYADVLQNNTNSKYAGSFEDDQFRQSLVKQQEESQKGVTQNKGTQQEVFAPVVDQIAVMRSLVAVTWSSRRSTRSGHGP